VKNVVPTPVQVIPLARGAVTPKTVKNDIDLIPTPEKLREANAGLKLSDDTIRKMREAGISPKTPVVDAKVSVPKRRGGIKGKYTEEQWQKYLAASKLIEAQKKKKALGGK
jgi:hypothetical protein